MADILFNLFTHNESAGGWNFCTPEPDFIFLAAVKLDVGGNLDKRVSFGLPNYMYIRGIRELVKT